MSSMEIAFRGVVTKTNALTGSEDGQSAIVRLDAETEGYKLAVVHPETKGREDLRRAMGRGFMPGDILTGRGTRGPESIRADFVELAPKI